MLPERPQGQRGPLTTLVYKRRGRVGLFFVAALSVLAGMTDAIGFLATGDFVSFMSGNTTRMAVALGDAHWALVARLALLIGAFIAGNALGVIIARLSAKRAWPLLALSAALLLGAGSLLLEGPAAFSATLHSGSTAWGALLFLAFGATALAYAWYFDGVKALGAGAASGYITLVPLFGVLISALWLGESIDTAMLIGGALAIAGTAVMNIARLRA